MARLAMVNIGFEISAGGRQMFLIPYFQSRLLGLPA
jgi:hypothetical protein